MKGQVLTINMDEPIENNPNIIILDIPEVKECWCDALEGTGEEWAMCHSKKKSD